MKNSELGFVGDERLYLSYSFPVKLGGRCGVSPLHPSRDIVPAPSIGYCNIYLANIVPMLQRNTHTDFRK